ncbi:MAG TPA: pitrilysin family protein [Verrucomicrobiae bacterium]|nr:pitrilysin family protein [Verrucomicrobiae bacterium]
MLTKLVPLLLVLFIFGFASTPASARGKIFPFPYTVDDLDNGLRLVVVPLSNPNVVAHYIVVRTGSRNEVEPGKSGFAHFFEHMMFRGTDRFSADAYDALMKAIGAETNAFTNDDYTCYHTLFVKDDLEKVVEIEADRFQGLKYPEPAFRTEAKAVLGEYNKNSANPISQLFEKLQETAYDRHTYKHTTMGFLKDIEAMPEQFEYSRQFFDRFYRPENTVLVIAGDVRRDAVLAMVKKHWGSWKRGTFRQEIPVEPEQAAARQASVDWPTPTLPWVAVAYKGPAYSDSAKDMPSMDLIASIAFSSSSPLYQKLVIHEQKVDALSPFFGNSRDPGLVVVFARVKDAKDVEYVKGEILRTFEETKAKPVGADRLAAVKSNQKYSFALRMDNTESVASILSDFLQLNPDPETVNRLYATYDSITPEDLTAMANKYFAENRRTIVTLAHRADAAGN